MKGLLIRWVINALALILISQMIKGIEVDHIASAFVAAAVLGVINAVLRPILILLTLTIVGASSISSFILDCDIF